MTKMTCLGGRYPYALCRYDCSNITARLRTDGDRLLLRIDDTGNIDRWEEFEISVESVERLLAEKPNLAVIPF